LFVIPQYTPDVAGALEPITPGAMLLELAGSTFNLSARPGRALDLLASLVGPGRCYRLAVNDLDHAAELISAALDDLPEVAP
jgi:hypothetical protein